MAATIAPIQPQAPVSPVAPVGPAPPQLALQPGTVVSAEVLQVLENGLAEIAIEGIALTALTEIPLQPGATLNLAVSQGTGGVIRLSVVPPGASAPTAAATSEAAAAASGPSSAASAVGAPEDAAPAATSPSPPTQAAAEALAVAVATQDAAPRQQSLAPLFANLPVVAASEAVPPEIQSGATQLLALRPALSEQLSADDLSTAFNQSGLFLEAALAAGSAPDPSTDLKAALVSFRQVLSSWLVPASGETTATTSALTPQPLTQPQLPTRAGSAPVAPDITAAPATPPVSQGTGQGTQASRPVLPIAMELPLAPVELEVAVVAEALGTASTALSTPTPQPGAAPVVPQEVQQPSTAAAAGLIPDSGQLLLPTTEARLTAPLDAAGPARALQVILTLAEAAQWTSGAGPVEPSTPGQAATTASQAGTAPLAAPPFRGSAPSAQPIAQPSLSVSATPREIAQRLLAQTDGALARQTLLQVASLPDRTSLVGGHLNATTSDTISPRWSFEIPFATSQGTALAQFEIERDGGNGSDAQQGKRVWRARFSLDIEPAGPVHALVSLVGDKTAVRMWAERPETAVMLRADSGQLLQALRAAELEPGDVVISSGTAPAIQAAKAGHFLDRAS